MVNGLDYLETIRMNVLSKTVSRFLPNVLTYRALKTSASIIRILAAKLPGLVKTGAGQFVSAPTSKMGGWGWWIDDDSNPYLTAYVVYGLIQARAAGFDVHGDRDRSGRAVYESPISATRPATLVTGKPDQQAWFLFRAG